jgi:hypothetical protein
MNEEPAQVRKQYLSVHPFFQNAGAGAENQE